MSNNILLRSYIERCVELVKIAADNKGKLIKAFMNWFKE